MSKTFKKGLKWAVSGLLVVASSMTIANGVNDWKDKNADETPDTNIEQEVEATE